MKIALTILQFVVCITLIASVLLQPGKTAGLSGSIAGGAEQLFGKKKSKSYEDLLEKVSTITAVLFLVLSVVLFIVK